MRALTAALLAAGLGVGPGCGDGSAGPAGPAGPAGDPGADGPGGADGSGCTVEDNGDGTKTVTCGDDSIVVSDGTPGLDGDDCTVEDHGDGTATITCGETSVVVRLPEGGGGVAPFTPDPRVNYWAVHDPGCPSYDDDCMSCHAEQLGRGTLDPSIPGFHERKLATAVIPGATDNDKCGFCHVEVDPSRDGTVANLRRIVDVALCVTCHSGGTYAYYRTP